MLTEKYGGDLRLQIGGPGLSSYLLCAVVILLCSPGMAEGVNLSRRLARLYRDD